MTITLADEKKDVIVTAETVAKIMAGPLNDTLYHCIGANEIEKRTKPMYILKSTKILIKDIYAGIESVKP